MVKGAKRERLMGCLFCGFSENGYRSDPDRKPICSQCVQLLLSADQAELRRAYTKAIEKGYSIKARAIQSFLISEETSVRETKIIKRNMVRKGHMRTIRSSRN